MDGDHVSQRFLPLVTVENADVAADYGQIAEESGLQILEVGFRTAQAHKAVAKLRSATDLIVVAGTLTSAHAVDLAIESGAHWGIAPNFDPEVLEHARRHKFQLVPGIATPSELGLAEKSGFSKVKLYPATQLGGVRYISALHAVFPEVELIPSGGISLEEVSLYLSTPGVTAVSGSWMPAVGAHGRDVQAEEIVRIVKALNRAVTETH